MQIAFFTNYLTHHQIEFCDILYEKTQKNFYLVVTRDVDLEQKLLGYSDLNSTYPYVVRAYEPRNERFISSLCLESDVVIFGSAPLQYLEERAKVNKITFIYTERIFKKGYIYGLHPNSLKYMYQKFISKKNSKQYYLCASAFASNDINLYTHTPEKFFKWGYFPPCTRYQSVDELLSKKRNSSVIEIMWAGRFISWKHPESVIYAANYLERRGIPFHVTMVGNGEKFEEIKSLVSENLKKRISFLGAVQPEKVRELMERSDIYLATSDFNEGWGAVVNEALNSACAVVASHAMGSVPFLINHGTNGIIYNFKNTESLGKSIEKLILDKELRLNISKNAYATITEEWNAGVATERFFSLCESLISENKVTFNHGPCSNAGILRNSWFKEDSL